MGDRAYAVWEIKPLRGRAQAEDVESIGSIKYGVVPRNYVQVYPDNGVPPPSLIEGERYEYWFQTLNAPHARAYFEIRDGKPVELESRTGHVVMPSAKSSPKKNGTMKPDSITSEQGTTRQLREDSPVQTN